MGGLDAVCLYYGYKFEESDLRSLFEADYMKSKYYNMYCESDSDDCCDNDNDSDAECKINNNNECKFTPVTFRDYLDSIFTKLGAKRIVARTFPCCNYRKNGYWIIGKRVSRIEALDMAMRPVILPTTENLKLIDPILEKLVTDSGLSKVLKEIKCNDSGEESEDISEDTKNIIPQIYAVGNYCSYCS